MFKSHAQNFEDVILWRALKHVTKGFYLDIGANDPIQDSVSLSFYEQGWRGAHVEPVPDFAERLRSARFDEDVIQVAIGTHKGDLKFFKVGDTGLSTGDTVIAEQHSAAGHPVELITVRCVPLSTILARYADRDIHWLKIDVEGMEKDVIESWRPSPVRPWIVIVESTKPNSQEENHQAWEPALISLGYTFVYFDGLNRYYVSDAQCPLASAFGPGPNYFDDFSLTRTSPFCRQISAELEQVSGKLESKRAELNTARLSLRRAATESKALRKDLQGLRQEVQAREAEIRALRESTSWRVTVPLRKAIDMARLFARGMRAWITYAPGSRPHRLIKGLFQPATIRPRANYFLKECSVSRPASDKRGIAPHQAVYLFVDHTISCNTNTGVQRTTRGLARGFTESGLHVRYVKWDDVAERCVLINREEREYLAAWNGPHLSKEEDAVYLPAAERLVCEVPGANAGGWLIVPEVTHITPHPEPVTSRLIKWAQQSKLKTGFVFYDAIPLRREEFQSVAERHAEYMQHLLLADVVWPISKWSADDLVAFWSASERATGKTMPHTTPILLPGASDQRRPTQIDEHENLILCVGTLEPRKNQLVLIRAFQDHRRDCPDSPWTLIFVGNLHPLVAEEVHRAVSTDSQIKYLGHVPDAELDALYRRCAFTVFPSAEEGFGLPIVESLWHGKPCICANFGSMAEVAAGGGCLTVDTRRHDVLKEAVDKLMEDANLRRSLAAQAIARPMITWIDYATAIRNQIDPVIQARASLGQIYFWIDATLTFPKNTGIQRVTRQLARELLNLGFNLVPVKFDRSKRSFLPTQPEDLEYLAQWNGPRPEQWANWIDPGRAGPNSWLLMTELPLNLAPEEQHDLVNFARTMKLRCGAVFYDSIPWKLKDLYPEEFSRAHKEYMIELGRYDLILPISDYSCSDFVGFLGSHLDRPLGFESRVKTISLPGEFPERPRVTAISSRSNKTGVTIICVGTVEPRKNHLKLLRAFTAAATGSSVSMRLIIVGRRTEPDLASEVEAYISQNPMISWNEYADDSRLSELHMECDFTVYSSIEEGFGLPILESVWYGKPCICANFGAMAEAAQGGGCVMVDVRDEDALALAIRELVENPERIEALSREAVARPMKAWRTYAEEVAVYLAEACEEARPDVLPLQLEDIVARAKALHISERPKLSVCISTYNRAEWLSVSLRNLANLYPDPVDGVEFFICDNASTDQTRAVVQPYLERGDVSYLCNRKNVGMLGNLRETVQHASGDYVWILGDDDLIVPGALEHILRSIDDNPGVALVYLNYAFTRIADARTVTDFEAFFRDAVPIVRPESDRSGPIKAICARNENFFTAIYTLVLRRDHAMRAYSQDTSGRPFSTMKTCIPTTFYVLNNMMDESGVWVGTPQVVINMNVSWMRYAPLWILERIPEVYDLAEAKGVATEEIDRWRRHTVPSVISYFREIYQNDHLDNSAFFSIERLLRRFKHLPEFSRSANQLHQIYCQAYSAGHPAARISPETLFGARVRPRGLRMLSHS